MLETQKIAREIAGVGLAGMVGNDVVGNRIQAFIRLHHFGLVNGLHLNVLHAIFLLDGTNVFHRELEHVLITDCIGDDVFMQTFVKQVFRGAPSVYVSAEEFSAKIGVPVNPNICTLGK